MGKIDISFIPRIIIYVYFFILFVSFFVKEGGWIFKANEILRDLLTNIMLVIVTFWLVTKFIELGLF